MFGQIVYSTILSAYKSGDINCKPVACAQIPALKQRGHENCRERIACTHRIRHLHLRSRYAGIASIGRIYLAEIGSMCIYKIFQ